LCSLAVQVVAICQALLSRPIPVARISLAYNKLTITSVKALLPLIQVRQLWAIIDNMQMQHQL
jgi:hypothetical protein